MLDGQDDEVWALQIANVIAMREGLRLADAAQCLDKKRTREGVYQLRSAIAASLVEASRMRHAAQ